MKKLIIIIGVSCLMLLTSTVQAENIICTMDYNPVCAKTQAKACLSLDCAVHNETYSNRCMMENAESIFLYEGECKIELPEATDDKYYIGDTNKCMIIKYRCDEGYKYFSDSIGCGCEKSYFLPEQERERINGIFSIFFEKIEQKNIPDARIFQLIEKLQITLEQLVAKNPKYENVLYYSLEVLEGYKDRYSLEK